MLQTSDAVSRLAAPTDALSTAPPALRVVTPILEALGLAEAKPSEEPSAVRAEEAAESSQTSIVDQAWKLVELSEESPTAWARLAQALHNAGDTGAVDAARRALELAKPVERAHSNLSLSRPVDAPALYVAGSVLASSGHTQEAEAALAKLPSTGEYRVLSGALAADRKDFETALERVRGLDGGAASALRGWVMIQLGRYQQAIHELRCSVREYGPSAGVMTNLAYAFGCLGSNRKAIRFAREAVQLAPYSRRASFNLVGYLQHSGQFTAALSELNRLSKCLDSLDADVALAQAGVLLRSGEEPSALKLLRHIRGRMAVSGGVRAHAELAANTALLEWRAGLRNRSSLLGELHRQIERAQGESVPLLLMLADVSSDDSVLDELRSEAETARRYGHTEEELFPLDVRIAQIGNDYERALEIARVWADRQPLDANAAAAAVHLEAQVLGQYEWAGERGLQALGRVPWSPELRNNTAFALALANRSDEAARVLEVLEVDTFISLATRGLIALSAGAVSEGLEKYRASIAKVTMEADPADKPALISLIAMNAYLACRHFGIEVQPPDDLLPSHLPPEWRHMPAFLLLERVAKREGVVWPG